jgi:hypothetical protein
MQEFSAVRGATPDLVSLALRRVRHRFPGPKCVARTLAGKILVFNAGHQADILVGARKTSAGLEIHSWLESDGELIGENPAEIAEFTRFEDIEQIFGSPAL